MTLTLARLAARPRPVVLSPLVVLLALVAVLPSVGAVTREQSTQMTQRRVNPESIPIQTFAAQQVPPAPAQQAPAPPDAGWAGLDVLGGGTKKMIMGLVALGMAYIVLQVVMEPLLSYILGQCPVGDTVVLKYESETTVNPTFAQRWYIRLRGRKACRCVPRKMLNISISNVDWI